MVRGFLLGVVTTLVAVIAVFYGLSLQGNEDYSDSIYTTTYHHPPPGPIFQFAMFMDSFFWHVPNKMTPPPFRVMDVGFQGSSKAILVSTAAELGIADALRKKGPLGIDELSRAIGNVHAPYLARVLRSLIKMGFFHQLADGRYVNNKLSAVLCADHPNTMRPVLLWGRRNIATWQNLTSFVRSGEVPDLEAWWAELYKDEKYKLLFADFMQSTANLGNQAVVQDYDFCQYNRVIDMGGGTGGLLKLLLAQCPNTKGTIFELPELAKNAEEKWKKEFPDLLPRASFISGSFLDAAPAIESGSAFVFRGVLHDWSDEKVTVILKKCHEAMAKLADPQNAKLVLVEFFPDLSPGAGLIGALIDVQMLLISGKERTVEEWDALLAATRFRRTKVTTTRSPLTVLEAVPI